MLALLRTRRWLGFTAVVLTAILAFGLLSLWQWHRAEDKRIERQQLEQALDSAPADISTLAALPLGYGEWRPITASGTYDNADTVLVRRRPLDARNGMWVMTPLRTSSGAIVWVNRGWIAAASTAEGTPLVPPAPSGEVTVIGSAREYELAAPSDNDGLPAGQVAAAAAQTLPEVGAVEGYYLQTRTSQPDEPDLETLPLPEIDEGRNVSYAIQWILFACVGLGGWFYFLRREAREDRART